ncbi:hypothetical protein HF086_017814 [Spodoptera exigua]|uniref:Uncharacterized protein n=1 Tax=Spodoptera exigua TaxID=7107 RepID=A0A922M2G4_SPOEX|nr:hypothetical protein HF086_017814 [Spodoptera exigua]
MLSSEGVFPALMVSYEQSAITYVWKNDEDTLRKSPSLTTLNAYLIQNQTIPCPIKASWRAEGNSLYEEDEEMTCNLCQRRFEEQGTKVAPDEAPFGPVSSYFKYFLLMCNYSCLKVDLIFTRDRAFYFTTVFIPGIILVTSSFITFWLEWNAVPARSMIGKNVAGIWNALGLAYCINFTLRRCWLRLLI